MRTLIIGPNDAGQRLDKFLLKSTRLPKSLMNKYIRKKRIKRNGARTSFAAFLSEGDEIALYINDEFFPAAAPPPRSNLKLDIVYEDAHLLLIWKPAGLLVHADAKTKQADTLAGAIIAYLADQGSYCPDREHSFTPAVCNRLDRNTEGLIIAAKDAPSLRLINEKIRQGQVEKHYLCQVEGRLFPPQGALHGYIYKDHAANRSRLADTPLPGGKEVRLSYQLLAYDKKACFSTLDINLLTGRSHQIRVQLAALGHPIRSDRKYGAKSALYPRRPEALALCAYRLYFARSAHNNLLSYLEGQTFTRYPLWWPETSPAAR